MYVCTCTYTYVITMCIHDHNVVDTYILSGQVMHMGACVPINKL